MTELSSVTKNGTLISEKDWLEHVESMMCPEEQISKHQAVQKVKGALCDAVKKRVPKEKFGICFSGGVDSTAIALICRQLDADFICYSVGVKNSQDLQWSEKIGSSLNFVHKSHVLSMDELEETVKKVAWIIKEPDVVKVGVGAVFYAAAELAGRDNIRILFSGLGSEEIFAGYERHAVSNDINGECWSGLKKMWSRDLTRDYAIAKALKIEVRTPFLDKELISAAMKIPGKYKIEGDIKKLVLREAALELGLAKEFAFRKKTAAQYGSRFNDMLDKIARKNGFKLKKAYLQSLLS